MGAHHNVDVLRREAQLRQIVDIGGVGLLVPVRPKRPFLVVADAAVDQDGVVFCPHDIALHGKDQIAAHRLQGVRHQPMQVRFPVLRRRFREKLVGVEIRRVHLQHARDRHVAQLPALHEIPSPAVCGQPTTFGRNPKLRTGFESGRTGLAVDVHPDRTSISIA